MLTRVLARYLETTERLASAIVDAALEVHKQLGPGLLESIYRRRADDRARTSVDTVRART